MDLIGAEGLFPESDARLDPRRLTPEQRASLLDSEYTKVLLANGGTYWLTSGPETVMLWDATASTFIKGIWVASIVCAQATCERTLASLMTMRYRLRPEPKNWRRWGLGDLIRHAREEHLVEPGLLEQIEFVCDARKPFGHWRDPMDADSLERVGMAAHQRGEGWGEGQNRHVAQLAFICTRTALRSHFGDLTRSLGRKGANS